VLQRFLHRHRHWLGALVVIVAAVPAFAQNEPSNKLLLENFIHYVIIGKHDLAASNAQVLLDTDLSDQELAELLATLREPERFRKAIRLGLKQDESNALLEAAAALERRMEAGYRARAREPERIQESIQMLLGGQRSVFLGRERLIEAGEYAVPYMLTALRERGNPILKAELMQTLRAMGGRAVVPLSEALPDLEPELQERLAGVLGEIGYPTSVPALYKALIGTNNNAVRQALRRALERIAGPGVLNMSLAQLQIELAEQYLDRDRSLLSFPGEAHQLVWHFEPRTGLVATAVRTEIFFPVQAMRYFRRALTNNPASGEALSGWIAANFKREINLPEDYEDPTYGPQMREPMYYAVAAGPAAVHPVLGRALEEADTALARKAIEALSRTAGADSLWLSDAEMQPLAQALMYPDRRVRAEAALTLASAMPMQPFDNSDRVVPELASAIRAAGTNYAVVISDDREIRLELASTARDLDFTVLAPASRLAELSQQLAETPGVDLVLLAGTATQIEDQYERIRQSRYLAATPLLILADTGDRAYLAELYRGDPATRVIRLSADNEAQQDAILQLLDVVAGGLMSEDESRQYALRALSALHDLAVGRNPVFNVGDASRQLIAALSDTQEEVRLSIADVLALIDQRRAQVSLMDAANNADGDVQLALLESVTASARRYGNLLERRQVEELLTLVQEAEGELATTAAATAGALDLPASYLLPLIQGEQN
jgi:hypothetical protein